jgi:hypothetical protein
MSHNQPNQIFLSKIYVATLFGRHRKCIVYHNLHIGKYLTKEATFWDSKEAVVFFELENVCQLG